MFEPFHRQSAESCGLFGFDRLRESAVRSAIENARMAITSAKTAHDAIVEPLVQSGCEPDDACIYAIDEAGSRGANAHFLGALSLLLTALHIEAVVNAWGVFETGQGFFDNHLDRNSAITKMALIIGLRGSGVIPEDHPAMENVRALFKRRNSIVHPKTFDLTEGKLESLTAKPTDFAGIVRSNAIDDHVVAEKALDAFKRLLVTLAPDAALICGGYNQQIKKSDHSNPDRS